MSITSLSEPKIAGRSFAESQIRLTSAESQVRRSALAESQIGGRALVAIDLVVALGATLHFDLFIADPTVAAVGVVCTDLHVVVVDVLVIVDRGVLFAALRCRVGVRTAQQRIDQTMQMLQFNLMMPRILYIN